MNTVWALKPGLRLYQLVGYAPFSVSKESVLEKSRRMGFYSLGLVLVFGALALFSFFFEKIEDEIESTIKFLLLVLIYAVHFSSLVEAFFKRDAQIALVSNFNEVDQLFQRKFRHKSRVSLRQHFSKALVLLLALIAVIFSADIGIYVRGNHQVRMNYLAIFFIPYVLTFIRYFQIIYFVHMIKTRFEFLIQILREVLQQRNTTVIETTITFSTQVSKLLSSEKASFKNSVAPIEEKLAQLVDTHSVEILREVYNKLWQNSQLINTAFGFSLLMNLGYDFLALTTNGYWLFAEFGNPTPSLYGDKFIGSMLQTSVSECCNLFDVI